MFDPHTQMRYGRRIVPFHTEVSGSEPLPMIFSLWMAEVARDHLRLGVYFRAVGIMLQIPGAAKYQFVVDDGEAWDLIRKTDRNALFNVLAECLDRLGAKELIEQVPGAGDELAGDDPPRRLSRRWKKFLDRRARVRHGLLNVVAECLDALVVRPGIAEIEAAGEQPWWHRWRPSV